MMDVQTLENLTIVAPLGLRFWDPVDATAISEGLEVTIWPAGQPDVSTPAIPNRSGVFAFQGLPGMREVEHGAGDDVFWATHPPQRDFTVQVQDLFGRFLPMQIPVRLPVRGLPDAIPLFSAPARPLVSPMAVVRAQILDTVSNVPAAWVLVDANFDGGRTVRGMSDARGSLLLALPYPEASSPGPRFGSPPPQGTKLADQTWPVTLAFHYTPRQPVPTIPDMEQVLSQAPAEAWQDQGFTRPLTTAVLRFGRELILRTDAKVLSPPAPVQPDLWITPAGSPPMTV